MNTGFEFLGPRVSHDVGIALLIVAAVVVVILVLKFIGMAHSIYASRRIMRESRNRIMAGKKMEAPKPWPEPPAFDGEYRVATDGDRYCVQRFEIMHGGWRQRSREFDTKEEARRTMEHLQRAKDHSRWRPTK